MSKQNQPRITITIDGKDKKLTLKAFLRVAGEALDILNDVEIGMSGQNHANMDWEIISIQKKNPLSFTVVASADDKFKVSPKNVAKASVTSLKTINYRATKPRYYSQQTLLHARGMVSPLAEGLVDSIDIQYNNEKPVRLTKRIINNVDRLSSKIIPHYQNYGSHEGFLEILDVHGKKQEMFIYDILTKEAIRCYFKKDIAKELGANITSRIRVFGDTKYRRKDHKPISVKVDRYEIPNKNNKLPTIIDLHKENINITNGMDSADFVRNLRNAD